MNQYTEARNKGADGTNSLSGLFRIIATGIKNGHYDCSEDHALCSGCEGERALDKLRKRFL